MKKLLTIFLIGIGFFAKAQGPTVIASHNVYGVATDTFTIPSTPLKNRSWFAVKGDTPYMWSVPQQKWIPLPGGGGGGAVSSVFGRTGAVTALVGDYSSFYYPLSSNPAGYLTGTTGYTKTQINSFFGGTTAIGGYNKSNWDAAFGWGNHAGLYPTITRFTDSLAAHHTRIMSMSGGGGAGGDMEKADYDTDNDGIVDNSELLAGQNTAYYLARANHTGTQAISTITGLQTALDAKQAALNGTGFVKIAGTTITYDNTNYTPTSRTINGQALTSNVTLTTTNIAEGTNEYHTPAKVQAIIDANLYTLRNSLYPSGYTIATSIGANTMLLKKINFTGTGISVTVNNDSALVFNFAGGGTGGDAYLASTQTFTGINTFSGAYTNFNGYINLGVSGNGIIGVPTNEGLVISNGSTTSTRITNSGIHTYWQNLENAGNHYVTGPSGVTSTGRFKVNTAGTDMLGDVTIETLANDNTLTNILVQDPVTKILKYRTVASLSSGGSGTVNNSPGGNRLAYYAGAGTTVDALAAITGLRAVASDVNGNPVASATTATELGYLSGASSNIQTQLTGKVNIAGSYANPSFITSLDASKINGLATGGGILYESSGSIATSTNLKYNPANGRFELTGSYNDYNGFSVKNTSSGIYAFADYIAENNVGTLGSVGVGSSNYTYLSGRNRTGIGGTTGVSIISNTDTTTGGADDIRFYPGGVNVDYFGMGSYGLKFPDGTFQTTAAGGGSGTAPTVTSSSATSLTLTVTGSYRKSYVFTGSSNTTWTLPAIGTPGQELSLINTGTANITVQRAGSNQIYSDEALTSFIIYPGDVVDLQDITTYWKIK